MAKTLLCRLGFHKYATQHAEDGTRFRACTRCGQEDPTGPGVPGAPAA